MRSYVSRVIEPEEAAAMSNDELMAAIREGLFINEGATGGAFRSDRKAEYLERAIYWCPYCGLSKFESGGNEIVCCTCGRRIVYGEDKRLTGVGFDFLFGSVADWYDAQSDFVGNLDLSAYAETPAFTDTADLFDVELNRRKQLIRKDATLRLYGDRVEIDADEPIVLRFTDIRAAAALGRNKLNLYAAEHTYQLKGDKRFNALKYVNICYSSKNIDKGDGHGKFLGL